MPPQEIAKNSDIIFLMLGYPKDVNDVVLNQLLPHLEPGKIIVDHTTSSPALAQDIYNTLNKKDIFSIDAPVTGGDMGAKAGKLTIMCGG